MGVIKDRMVEDLRLKGYAQSTQREYVRCATNFVRRFMRPPTELDADDVRAFLVELVDDGKSPSVRKMYTAAIRFLYKVTLKRPEVVADLLYPKVPIRVPEILSGTEVLRLFEAIESPKYRTAMKVAYGTGLRSSEVCRLQVSDIDSQRMVVRVREGKGAKDRYTMLPEQLLCALRGYWRATRPDGPYLFPSPTKPGEPMSPRSLEQAVREAVQAAGLTKRVTPHTLRHCFATHMLAMGADIRQLQIVLGHSSIKTTARYTHMSKRHIAAVASPLDLLGTEQAAVLG